MLRRGFLTQEQPNARPHRQLRSNLLELNRINGPNYCIEPNDKFTQNDKFTPSTKFTPNNTLDEKTYFDLLPLNVKQMLMQWIWYTQPKINWMGDGRDESIKLNRMIRLQRIANEILKINNVKICG